MSIFDIFTNNTPAQPAPVQQLPVQAPVNPGNIPNSPVVVADPNNPTAPIAPVVPANPTVPDLATGEPSLDSFKHMWDTPPVDPNNPTAPTAPAPLNVEDLQKTVGTIDFTQAISAEQLAAINEGGEGATNATLQAMNNMVQKVMVQNTLVNNKLTEQAVAAAVKIHTASLPELLRQQATADHMKNDNPLFSDPSVKNVMEATRDQLLVKFPTATNEQITTMTKNYIVAAGKAFTPQVAVNDNSAGDTDWMAYMESPTPKR